MAQIKQKLTTINDALKTLKDSIGLFEKYSQLSVEMPTEENMQMFLGMRDSMIQRFEYCTDLFWKVLKIYLEDIEKVTLAIYSPKGVVREAVKARILSEQEGQDCMNMVTDRNRSSYIYHEEIAEEIAHKVPEFYQLIKTLVDRVQEKINV